MMQWMMAKMIRSMSVEEKQAMMLRMMPEMMKEIDLNRLVLNMMQEVGQLLTLYSLYKFVTKAGQAPVLTQALSKAHESMMENMPQMAPMMMPIMQGVMSKMMPQMIPMMSGMLTEMDRKDRCIMIDALDHVPGMKSQMGEIMFTMAPRVAVEVIPKDKRKAFIGKLEKKFADG
jgi:hypothetical protein